jgi:hypothetical protein
VGRPIEGAGKNIRKTIMASPLTEIVQTLCTSFEKETMSTPPRPSPSTERSRRHRQRRRRGTRCITVDVNESEVAALVARGYLPEEARSRPHASGRREDHPRPRRDRRRQHSGQFGEFGSPFVILPDQAIEIVAIEKKVMVGRVTRSAYAEPRPERAGRRRGTVRRLETAFRRLKRRSRNGVSEM